MMLYRQQLSALVEDALPSDEDAQAELVAMSLETSGWDPRIVFEHALSLTEKFLEVRTMLNRHNIEVEKTAEEIVRVLPGRSARSAVTMLLGNPKAEESEQEV